MSIHTDPVSRVNAGAEYLDRRVPGWLDAMPEDLSELNINHDDRCIVGHVYGAGRSSLDRAGVYTETQAQRLGFMPLYFFRHPIAAFGDNRRLTEAWRRKIASLRGNLRAGEGQGQ
jgi:hypothetical protein